jgi:putative toxin-antitoxin system antitoxin component (TIGR02293 family)
MNTTDIDYNYPEAPSLQNLLKEPETLYRAGISPFSLDEFEKLCDLLGFSQAEWSAILHISLRSLQRYLKEGKPFKGLQAELLLHLKKMVQLGLQLFETPSAFVAWLRLDKPVLGQSLNFEALQSISGIQQLKKELGRIAYGVYI